MSRADDEQLHRYFDGDLSAAEARELEQRLDADASLRAKLDGLAEVRGAIRESVKPGLRAMPSSDDLWASIESQIDAPKAETAKPKLGVVQGGASGKTAKTPARTNNVRPIALALLAVAAAVTFVLWPRGVEAPEPIAEQTVPPAPTEEEVPAPAELALQTEVVEVDFGAGSGAIFEVEGDDGGRYAVVWLADDGEIEPGAPEVPPEVIPQDEAPEALP